MNKRILKAIETRIKLVDYIRNVKEIDPTVSGFEFRHDDTRCIFNGNESIKKQWQKLANDYVCKLNNVFKKNVEASHGALYELDNEVKNSLKELYREMLIRAISEVVVCDSIYDSIYVTCVGIVPSCSRDLEYSNEGLNTRYLMPDDAADVLMYVNSYELIGEVLNWVYDEVEEYSDLIGFDFNNYCVRINLASE